MAVGDASPNEVDEVAYGLKGPLIAQLPSATGADDRLPMAARANKECGGSGIVLEVNFDVGVGEAGLHLQRLEKHVDMVKPGRVREQANCVT